VFLGHSAFRILHSALQVEDASVSNLPLTMANEQNATRARRHVHHRGRRGADRRSHDRPAPPQAPPNTGARDGVDVEQIMREIRSRIPTRHGIELTRAQVQELAARRLDAILEPRHVKPELMEQLRRAAGEPIDVPPAPVPDAPPELDESALYSSHRAGLRRIRGWLRPILKLFFNPSPLIEAINAENRRAHAAAARERELHGRQAQWNALHYEILQRLVLEVSRASIEAQQLSMQVEALSAQIAFNERRLGSLEQAIHTGKPANRATESRAPEAVSNADAASAGTASPADSSAEGTRRRRRRRRGRRSGLSVIEGGAMPADADRLDAEDGEADADENGDDADGLELPEDSPEAAVLAPADAGGHRAPGTDEDAPLELPHAMSLVQPAERHPDPQSLVEPHHDTRREDATLAQDQANERAPDEAGEAPAADPGAHDRDPPDR
jgi:hypothetical protein